MTVESPLPFPEVMQDLKLDSIEDTVIRSSDYLYRYWSEEELAVELQRQLKSIYAFGEGFDNLEGVLDSNEGNTTQFFAIWEESSGEGLYVAVYPSYSDLVEGDEGDGGGIMEWLDLEEGDLPTEKDIEDQADFVINELILS